MTYGLVDGCRGHVPAAVACDALGVSRSAYYAHTQRRRAAPTSREQQDVRLEHAIRTAFDEHRGTVPGGRDFRFDTILSARSGNIQGATTAKPPPLTEESPEQG